MSNKEANVIDDEVSVKDIVQKIKTWLSYLKTKIRYVIITGIIFTLLGLCYSLFTKPLYTATLSFALEDSKPGATLSAYAGLASQFGLDVANGGGAFTGDNLIELMRSRKMIEKSLLDSVTYQGQNLSLAELYIRFNDLRNHWLSDKQLDNIKFLPGVNSSTFSIKQDSLMSIFYEDLLLKNLMVYKIDKKLSIINVTVTSKSEVFLKYFAQRLGDEVSKFYIETKTKKSAQNVNILEHQADSVRLQLNGAINGVASSIDVNPNPNPNRSVLRVPAQHKQVDVQANTTMYAELVKNLEIAKVSLRNETPLIQIIDIPTLPLKKDHIGKIKGTLIGFFLGVFISIGFLTFTMLYKSFLQDK